MQRLQEKQSSTVWPAFFAQKVAPHEMPPPPWCIRETWPAGMLVQTEFKARDVTVKAVALCAFMSSVWTNTPGPGETDASSQASVDGGCARAAVAMSAIAAVCARPALVAILASWASRAETHRIQKLNWWWDQAAQQWW